MAADTKYQTTALEEPPVYNNENNAEGIFDTFNY